MDYVIKEMSIDNLDLIAEGGMGKIYRINDEQILKVFNNITLEELEKQKTSAVEVLKTMVPTAISFEMVKVGDKYGINHEFLAKQPKNLLKSTCLTPKLAKQVAKITRSTYFEAMDIKAEKQYKKLMSGFVPFLLVLNLGRLGDKAEYEQIFPVPPPALFPSRTAAEKAQLYPGSGDPEIRIRRLISPVFFSQPPVDRTCLSFHFQ